jgi:hypothetical protein
LLGYKAVINLILISGKYIIKFSVKYYYFPDKGLELLIFRGSKQLQMIR